MRISAVDRVREGRKRAMLRRWKKDNFVIWLMCVRYERVESIMIPRFRTEREGVTLSPSIRRVKF